MSQVNCFILNWNVRGLNSRAKQDNVRLLSNQMKATVVCLQETKMESISDDVIIHSLGQRFVAQYAFLPAIGSSGGILLACDDNYFTISDVVKKRLSILSVSHNFNEK